MTVLDDPFAPQTEAAPVAEAPKQSDNPVSAYINTSPAHQSSDKIVVTLKGGTGYDAPWIVIHASDLQEAHNHFAGDNSKLMHDLMARVQNASKQFAGSAPTSTVAQNTPVQVRSNVPAGAQQAPGGETRQCSHGEMAYRTGRSQKDGGTWKAFMCPTPKGTPNQCAPQWIKD